jgi:hypothetical protein
LRKIKLKQFWGSTILDQDFVIAYGAWKDSRHRIPGASQYWYHKDYHDGSWREFRGPREYIVSNNEMRAASYLVGSISPYRKSAINVLADSETFPYLNRTIVALGSGSSNEITRLVIEDPENIFFEFAQVDTDYFIRDKRSGREFRGFRQPRPKDCGFIIKIPNQRFEGKNFFICAGLGEWGTSGASWYLANKWRDLNKEFAGAFGILVEVEIGSDESAIRVFP